MSSLLLTSRLRDIEFVRLPVVPGEYRERVCLPVEHPLIQWHGVVVREQEVQVLQPASIALAAIIRAHSLNTDRLTFLQGNSWRATTHDIN